MHASQLHCNNYTIWNLPLCLKHSFCINPDGPCDLSQKTLKIQFSPGVRWACPLSRVTFESRQVLRGRDMGSKVRPWQLAHYWYCAEGTARGKAIYEGVRWGVTVVRWCCHTHTGNEVSSCVGRVRWKGCKDFVCILARCSGIVCGLLVAALGVAWSFLLA